MSACLAKNDTKRLNVIYVSLIYSSSLGYFDGYIFYTWSFFVFVVVF
ncbi:hypothetical protein BN1221_04767c [Brenneria goodwinii]|uniref:Transmembrane protein n=1 Tax=Brenneria goodwinii TaxID=1109412 RepID=A0A0G4K232_9GAMM|nr:hypothetical protein BN1221_04767c [Brenneria goodwinii]